MKMKIIKLILDTATLGVALSLALVFIYSYSVYEVTPGEALSYMAASLGSSSGAVAEVPENPYNTLAQQLIDREEELTEREEYLAEVIVRSEQNEKITNLIFALVIFLLILLSLNFYLDYRSRRKPFR